MQKALFFICVQCTSQWRSTMELKLSTKLTTADFIVEDILVSDNWLQTWWLARPYYLFFYQIVNAISSNVLRLHFTKLGINGNQALWKKTKEQELLNAKEVEHISVVNEYSEIRTEWICWSLLKKSTCANSFSILGLNFPKINFKFNEYLIIFKFWFKYFNIFF